MDGDKILQCLRSILERCADFETQNRFPGEGGERRFRLWLATDLLTDILGWPAASIVQGERFDLILQDQQSLPLITFETKAPYHDTSSTERRDFVRRLPAFPTLRFGVLTSGDQWDIYRIEHTLGTAAVHLMTSFSLAQTTAREIAAAFQPLVYFGTSKVSPNHRYRISKSEPFIAAALLRLTAHLEAGIADLQRHFVLLFHGLRSGQAGPDARGILEAIYERWTGESLRVSPAVIAHALCETLRNEGRTAQPLIKCLSNLGFTGEGVQDVVDAVLSLSSRKSIEESEVTPKLWPIFEPWVRQLCAQTAHVQLARILLYRVGEDEGIFERQVSGQALSNVRERRRTGITGREYPILQQVEYVRSSMESLLPSVFKLSEFDWWMVRPEYRNVLTRTQQVWLQIEDEKYNAVLSSLLNRLAHYDFRGVDIDVWRNLYENYLPEDERRRLGGFYTPEALVNLTLDLVDYTSEEYDLCKLKFIDPSCGSGAFITTALGRLLRHLSTPMECHAQLHSRSKSSLQKAEALLRIVATNVNAIDVHPFASFLTTLNVLFAILPRYVETREHDPDFVMEFNIFAWDALDPPTEQLHQSNLFARMNARSQRGEHDYERYRSVMEDRFDRVIGNPPWGGVLNGPLAPVYDLARKRSYRERYPSAAQGKYDVYGLFIERAFGLLRPGGKFALITQATYIEKEWASGIRALLASNSTLQWIVDLNPFGQLFFRAMNAPCITVSTVAAPEARHKVSAILSDKPPSSENANRERRQLWVANTVRDLARSLEKSGHPQTSEFASGTRILQATLQEEASSRWNLARKPNQKAPKQSWHSAGELLEVRQGVTPGNALDIFLIDQNTADHLHLEKALLHKAIKSRDLTRWSLEWHGRMLLYPYVISGKTPQPAFRVNLSKIEDEHLASQISEAGLKDALDFDTQIDNWEKQLVRNSGVTKDAVAKLLQHRIANGLVRYPKIAEYLTQSYEHLFGRTFEHQPFTQSGKAWYEYHRPRDPSIMLAKARILSPSLVREARFVFDTAGHLSDHACLFLQPTKRTALAWKVLTNEMETCLGRKPHNKELLLYILGFLNSSRGSAALLEGRRPTPKGSYQVSEQSLREIFIAPPQASQRAKVKALMAMVGKLVKDEGPLSGTERERLEPQVDNLVDALLQSAD